MNTAEIDELAAQTYHGAPVRVEVDDRDIRGGEKKWFHVKRGVPIRLEVGPRDMKDNKVFLSRRDTGENQPIDREDFLARATEILDEIQSNLYQRALELRQQNTVSIDSLDEFKKYFTPKNTDKPKMHGGFAMCHWCEFQRFTKSLTSSKSQFDVSHLTNRKRSALVLLPGSQVKNGRFLEKHTNRIETESATSAIILFGFQHLFALFFELV